MEEKTTLIEEYIETGKTINYRSFFCFDKQKFVFKSELLRILDGKVLFTYSKSRFHLNTIFKYSVLNALGFTLPSSLSANSFYAVNSRELIVKKVNSDTPIEFLNGNILSCSDIDRDYSLVGEINPGDFVTVMIACSNNSSFLEREDRMLCGICKSFKWPRMTLSFGIEYNYRDIFYDNTHIDIDVKHWKNVFFDDEMEEIIPNLQLFISQGEVEVHLDNTKCITVQNPYVIAELDMILKALGYEIEKDEDNNYELRKL